MKSRLCLCISTVTLLVVAAIPFAAQSQQEHHRFSHYSVVNLGTPLGGTISEANSLNNLGWASGSAFLPGNTAQHAFLWAYGLKVPLGTFGGPNSLIDFPVKNNTGDLVGLAETSTTDPLGENFCQFGTGFTCEAFLWRFGLLTKLPTLGGNNGRAAGENDLGQIVGWAENKIQDPTCVHPVQFLQFEAVIWGPQKGQIKQLPPFPGDPDSAAVAINDQGQVVGISGQCDVAVGELSAEHGVLWQNGKVISIPTLGGIAWNTPDAINNRSQVAGFSDLPNDNPANPNFHAFFWTKESGTIDLGTLKKDGPNAVSEATGMNNEGQVVGLSCEAGFANCHAVLWQDGHIVDLNKLIPQDASLQLLFAGDINDEGEIAGQACVLTDGACTSTSVLTTFLLVPKHDWNDSDADSSDAQTNASPTAALPDNVRKQMMQRLGLGSLASK